MSGLFLVCMSKVSYSVRDAMVTFLRCGQRYRHLGSESSQRYCNSCRVEHTAISQSAANLQVAQSPEWIHVFCEHYKNTP